MFLLSNISFCSAKCLGTHCQGSFLPIIFMVCILSLEAVVIKYSQPKILLPVAIFVSAITFIIGIMNVFFYA